MLTMAVESLFALSSKLKSKDLSGIVRDSDFSFGQTLRVGGPVACRRDGNGASIEGVIVIPDTCDS